MADWNAMNPTELVTRVHAAWQRGATDRAPGDDTSGRIVDAASRQLELFGIQRTTMDDVARRAGVSRVTIYRHFATKDLLVEAVVLREVRRFLDGIRKHLDGFATDQERMVEGFVYSVTRLREHTLLRRLLEGEPELFLPQLTTGAGPLIALSRTLVVEYLRPRMPVIPEEDLALAAEMGIRVMLSLVVTPGSVLDLDDAEQLRRVARRLIVPMATLAPPVKPKGRRGA